MRITDVLVDGFGVWNGMAVNDLHEHVTVFFGPNEAGKTTLMQFIRCVLYGFSDERRGVYLPPVHGGTPGGLLRVDTASGRFEVQRRLAPGDFSGVGGVSVVGANGRRQGQHFLNVLTSGVDEPIFNNVFALGIRELQELGTLNDTQAAEHLYNLTTGLDRVSLVDVMKEVDTARRQILAPGDKKSQMLGLLNQRGKLLGEIEQLEGRTRRWSELATQRAALVEEVAQLDQQIARCEHDSQVVEIASRVRDKWLNRAELEKQLQDIGSLHELPEGCLDQLDELNGAIDAQRNQLRPLKQRRLAIRRSITAQPINEPLWNRSCRIEAMCEHAPWIASLDGQIERIKKELDESELTLLKHGEKLHEAGNHDLSGVRIVSRETLMQQLTTVANNLREAQQRRLSAKKQADHSSHEADHLQSQLESELSEHKNRPEDLDTALERTGHLAGLLRRRIQIDDRLDTLVRHRSELQGEQDRMLDEQINRVRLIVGVGVLFMFGTVMLLTGMFGWQVISMKTETCWALSLVGLITIAMSIAWKSVVEQTAESDLDQSMKRRKALESQLDQVVQERDEIERELPTGNGTYTSRLTHIEKDLKELEAMVPLKNDRSDAQKKIHAAKHHLSTADREWRDARDAWRKSLRKLGLPVTLTPKNIRQLGAHFEEASKLQKQVEDRRQRVGKLQQERDTLVGRIRQVYQDIKMHAVSEDPQVQISQLAAALSGQREMIDARKTLRKEDVQLRKEAGAASLQLRKFVRQRDVLLTDCRFTDENELREHAAKLALSRQLYAEYEKVSEQVRSVIGTSCSDEDVARELRAHGKAELGKRWELLVSKLNDSQGRLAQLHQRRGEINQEMKTLAEDTRLSKCRFELGCVEQKIKNVAHRWQVMATSSKLLEAVRVVYEAERQPETLGEASDYLVQLTEGKYKRVWTPLGKNTLRVDDALGQSLPLDVLSRGTREAVFLSLRLALTVAYARRGIALPMVLDDVLVNLDAKRTRAAVKTLCDFAKNGHQLLFFTCHDHVREMFLSAGVDVRTLPSHSATGPVSLPVQAIPAPAAVVPVAVIPKPLVALPIIELPPAPVPEPIVATAPVAPATPAAEEPKPKRRRRRGSEFSPMRVIELLGEEESTAVIPIDVEPSIPVVAAKEPEEYRLTDEAQPTVPRFDLRLLATEEESAVVQPAAIKPAIAEAPFVRFEREFVPPTQLWYEDKIERLNFEDGFADDSFRNSSTWEWPGRWWVKEEVAA